MGGVANTQIKDLLEASIKLDIIEMYITQPKTKH